jgi:hypothetical protein
MFRKPSSLRPRDVTQFFLLLAAVFGAGARLFELIRADFPLVDGGMFYTMVVDLQRAHYALPAVTSYNHLGIPYAYPPLGFYLTAALNDLTDLPLLTLVQWQPLVANLLVLPVVYLLARQLLRSAPAAALATFLFALTPNTYWWQITGGGLTRSLGECFGFLTAYFALRTFQEKQPRWLIGTIVAGALVVLSHPEWALQAALAGFLFGLRWGRNRSGLRNALLIVLGVALLTAPWWLTVVLRHGLGVFLHAGGATGSRWTFWTPLLTLSFTGEYVAFLSVFALVGVFLALARREFFLPLWVLAALVSDPRGGVPFALLPLVVLASGVVTDLVAPYFLRLRGRAADEWWHALELPVGKVFVGVLAVFCLANAYNVSNTVSTQVLGQGERRALAWIAAETDPGAVFLVLSGQGNPLHSPLLEWFPALADRRSLTTVQGREWLPGEAHYLAQLERFPQAQACLYAGTDCLAQVAALYGTPIDYVLVSQEYSFLPVNDLPLVRALSDADGYRLVHEEEGVRVFEKLP